MTLSRRDLLAFGGALVGAGMLHRTVFAADSESTASPSGGRSYHLSISPEALDADPELLSVVQDAGVTDLWITGFLYGYWHFSPEEIQSWRKRIESQGMAAHVINVPLGHPGDALGSKSGRMMTTPPKHWKPAVTFDGKPYCGTSLHPPATSENVAAIRRLAALGVRRIFLDDDFRAARSPAEIGGCFCEQHRQEFLRTAGLGDAEWPALLDDVKNRRFTRVLRDWVDFTCDQYTACFRAQQAAAVGTRLGIMVMYLGSEKSGLRLSDYSNTPFRVGECHFNDGSFAPIKGKTDELFSSLLHRRFVLPSLAYSETTAFPADALSAENMAAKLVISTISDVRNTMLMSGLTAFPRSYWQTLKSAMRRQAAQHQKIAGHAPRGPLKHFWGNAARYVGDDNPNSLFLAMGIPFEVTDSPASDGYTFLADADARSDAGELHSPGTTFIVRQNTAKMPRNAKVVPESLPALFELKRKIVASLRDVPYVEGDQPAVCAWYPTAKCVLLWNLSDQRQVFSLRLNEKTRQVAVDSLNSAIVDIA